MFHWPLAMFFFNRGLCDKITQKHWSWRIKRSQSLSIQRTNFARAQSCALMQLSRDWDAHSLITLVTSISASSWWEWCSIHLRWWGLRGTVCNAHSSNGYHVKFSWRILRKMCVYVCWWWYGYSQCGSSCLAIFIIKVWYERVSDVGAGHKNGSTIFI